MSISQLLHSDDYDALANFAFYMLGFDWPDIAAVLHKRPDDETRWLMNEWLTWRHLKGELQP